LGEFVWSSRRRHTRLISDWSSDVCSSDLLDDKARGQGDNCGELDYQKNVARARFNVGIDFTGIARLLARAGDCGPMQPIRAVLHSDGAITEDDNFGLSGPMEVCPHPFFGAEGVSAVVLPGR